MSTIILYSIIIVTFLIGYFRSSIDQQKPSGLVDLNEINKKWIQEDNWLSRITAVFSVLVIIYNTLIWGIYGITSVLDFLKFIVQKIWWLVLWIWNDVLHPTVFLVCKLLWHYLIVFCWKFFSHSLDMQKQEEVYNRKNIKHSFITLLKVFSLTIFLFTLSTIFNFDLLIKGLFGLIIFVFIQFNVFKSTIFFTKSDHSPIAKLKIVVTSLVVSGAFLICLLLLNHYSSNILVGGLGVSIAQISVPVFIIAAYIFIVATIFLMPYVKSLSGGSFSTKNFLKSSLIRVPKYIYSLPFHIIGIILSSFSTIIILYVLIFGIEYTTSRTMSQWKDEVMKMPNHIPNIKKLKNSIKLNENEIYREDSIYKKNKQMLDKKLFTEHSKLESNKKLRKLLVPNKIFSFDQNAYVSETQNFSFIEVLSSDRYKWNIYSLLNDSLIYTYRDINQKLRKDGIPNTYTMRYKWKKAGNYRVEVRPENDCASGSYVFRNVTVKDRPVTRMNIGKPIKLGKKYVCAYDTVKFLAPKLSWIKSWEWDIPNDYKIISNDNQQQITVVWGSDPGTVRVRAHGVNISKQISIWTGLLVNVKPKVGKEFKRIAKIPDEELSVFKPNRKFYFYTLVEAENAIKEVQYVISELETKINQLTKNHEKKLTDINSSIDNLREEIKIIRLKIFGTILGLIGLILLLSIAFTNLWTYFINYNYGIYNFEQEGTHYVNNQLSFYKNKNINQPLLGWFVVIILSIVVYLLIGLT
jgi:hypothetical protein